MVLGFVGADPARLGVVSFQVEGLPHGLVATILAIEAAVAVRSGCFCAHPYVVKLFGLNQEQFSVHKQEAIHGNRATLPGMVRASFGCYNQTSDIDRLNSTIRTDCFFGRLAALSLCVTRPIRVRLRYGLRLCRSDRIGIVQSQR